MTAGFRREKPADLIDTLDNLINRATSGIIIAAMIIGSSMIITTGAGPFLFGFGVIGRLISAVIGLWLVFNMIRGRNQEIAYDTKNTKDNIQG